MGQTYVKPLSASPIGDFSFHFDEERPYVDFTNSPEDWVFANGSNPGKVYFMKDWKYYEEDRRFEGQISFGKGGGYFKDYDSKFVIFFDESFINIERSDQRIFKDETPMSPEPFMEMAG